MLIKSRSVKGELEHMRKEMDRIWDRFSQDFSNSSLEQDWNPPLDLMETGSSLVVEIEVPGINPDNIDISVTADVLTFTGEKKKQAEDKGKSYHLVERTYGKFSRSIRLPTTVNPDQVEALYKDGILKITLGKTEAAKGKRIQVKTT